MNRYTAETYGERCADVYDEWYSAYDEAMIKTLAELAAGGRALELGVGTGRAALPLALTGITVHGIDASPAMVERLRAKPGGDGLAITIGNFADLAVEGDFSLIFAVFNTFFQLLSQEEQLRCFRHVARHLTAEGVFLLEVFVPDLARYSGGGQATRATSVTSDEISLDVARHDPIAQRVIGQKVILREEGIRLYPVEIRYAWPAELDLMARLAGLGLRHRWSDWRREPFTAESTKHISVYERGE